MLAAAWVVLGAMALPLAGGQVFHRDDLGLFHLPVRQHYARCLAAGDDYRWCPALYGGLDLHGEGQVGMEHPLHRLLYGTLPLATAFHLEWWLSYPVSFVGMALLLSRWRLRRDASLLGALVFTGSGFPVHHYVHMNAVAIIAQVPWLLLGMDVALRSADPRRAAWGRRGVAVLTMSQCLLGYPQYVVFSLLVELAYAAGLRVGRLDQGGGRWRALAGAKGLGLLGGAIQVLPTWEALARSTRPAPAAAWLGKGSLHPVHLVQWVSPYVFR
ncbi:MAG: hypothetical protein IRY99_24005, partial [Isosphaeraceae bacterium]|nr:hypothetical protein [Isosphaeraceae bacterium]